LLMKMRSKMQNQKGFTLVELMVVVVILGILVAIAVPVYTNITARANQKAVEANLRTIDGAIMQYKAANDGKEPTNTNDNEALKEYVQAWPEGPDTVEYDIAAETGSTQMRAVAAKKNAGDWWTLSEESTSLPITWPPKS
jgi:type II secretion system protein G